MAAPTTLRADRFVWYVRLLQALFVLIVLGAAGTGIADWASLGCSTPQRLAWNTACASLTLIVLLYLIPFTGPLSYTSLWNPWAQIALDSLFFVFWIAAAATSAPDHDDLCNACQALDWGEGWWVISGGTYFQCYSADDFSYRRSVLARGAGSSAAKTADKAATVALKQGFDAVMVFLFAVTLSYSLYKRKSTGSAAHDEKQQHQVNRDAEFVAGAVP